ncbi:transcription cofactor HES-6 isoform X2 [Choloepus didactylus]|uniref:transcription cofactor HES-6 isoform X2 n=1 Tax=Choloepus didactylus TaxID=27675 RepID=UPI00189EAE2E|nr:transcription cofactor HES-6 isoform X2 [Choloepus didactylus]
MAPPLGPGQCRAGGKDEDRWEARGDRKARKPLVEKKRRARINESLQELRLLLAGAEVRAGGRRGLGAGGERAGPASPPPSTGAPPGQVQAKLENAEVLELTVRRVQGALRGRAREREQLQAEASERFAAGYIQCMHEVHTFVSTCQAIDATVAAELLNHLLESMPLREGSSFRDLLGSALARPPGAPGRRGWPVGGAPGSPLPSSPGSGDDPCSDLEEAPEAEMSRAPAEEVDLVPAALGSLTAARIAQSVWRPW